MNKPKAEELVRIFENSLAITRSRSDDGQEYFRVKRSNPQLLLHSNVNATLELCSSSVITCDFIMTLGLNAHIPLVET